MNELLPYEEQLAGKLADIPLPDENPAWDAMRKMLDDDDDGIVPPPVNSGCRRWGLGLLLLLLLVSVTWGVYKFAGKRGRNGASEKTLPGKQMRTVEKDSSTAGQKHGKGGETDSAGSSKGGGAGLKSSNHTDVPSVALNKREKVISASPKKFSIKTISAAVGFDGRSPANKKSLLGVKTKGGGADDTVNLSQNKMGTATKIVIDDYAKGVVTSGKASKDMGKNGKEIITDTSAVGVLKSPSPSVKTNIDTTSSVKKRVLPAKKVDSSAVKRNVGDKTDDDVDKEQKFWFSAGLGLQQLIPIDGQKANPYNAFGRKGSPADYIPSAYFRVHKNKTFLQIEFKYGAPQYTKNIAYSTKVISVDTTNHITKSAVNQVEKTYYHQVPVSIHYEILPGFSAGAGIVWNRFQSAVVNQQTHTLHTQTGIDSVTGNNVIDVKSDSAFAKTYLQFMFEAQYAWKRISFGARYSAGLQPYITFTSPATGQTQRDRNASFNVFIRYELWRSKKK
jgi:hypothetical protein